MHCQSLLGQHINANLVVRESSLGLELVIGDGVETVLGLGVAAGVGLGVAAGAELDVVGVGLAGAVVAAGEDALLAGKHCQ